MVFEPFVKGERPRMAEFNAKFEQILGEIASAKDEAVQQALNDGVKIETGDYKGTGGIGQDRPTTINFSFNPKFVYVSQADLGSNYNLIAAQGQSRAGTQPYIQRNVTLIWGNNQLQFYTSGSDAEVQLNKAGYNYVWIAIG